MGKTPNDNEQKYYKRFKSSTPSPLSTALWCWLFGGVFFLCHWHFLAQLAFSFHSVSWLRISPPVFAFSFHPHINESLMVTVCPSCARSFDDLVRSVHNKWPYSYLWSQYKLSSEFEPPQKKNTSQSLCRGNWDDVVLCDRIFKAVHYWKCFLLHHLRQLRR